MDLRVLRGDRTLDWVKARTHFSVSKLSRIENGQRRLNNPQDVAMILGVLGVRPGPEHARLMSLAVDASKKSTAGFHRDAGAGGQHRLSGMVKQAFRLLAVDSHVIPGALQTRPYMEAVTQATLLRTRQHELPGVVKARLAHQCVVQESGVRAVYCVQQSALYRVMGDHATMVEQLEKVLKYTEMPQIGVRIIPVEMPLGLHFTNLTKLDFDSPRAMPELIYVEIGDRESHYYYPDRDEDSQTFHGYHETLVDIVDKALGREESRTLIRIAIEWHQKKIRGGAR
ncbi:Scr1 family TA system antitoxin-like transcriptional regulator [Kitasatospora sp. NPDC059795]|uniref:Scr1 family TA system antitoxin-like transcriptional regulator n=1 Tax=Kitasatospora sp. NPDC059795 TaxID=3346949 RepID=UPI00365F07AF